MAFISVAEEITKNSFTGVENKFISKYMPALDANAVKVYLYALYVCQNGLNSYTISDFANCLNFTEEKIKEYFQYLDEYEIISITSQNPFEIKILDLQNLTGTPKKYKPEKYSDFTKAVQSIIKGRMISTNEYMDYFYLLEEYSFEQDALIMIITYCVNLKGDDIRHQYIRKVAKSFADEGVTTTKKVEQKLSAYTASTPFLIKLFTAAGIRKQPDVDDDKLYKKWTQELGFEEDAIIAAAKIFKVKTSEKLNSVISELYKNRKFDILEIEDYCKSKNSVHALTVDIAKSLGVYMSDSTPYMENYTNVWYNYGFTPDCLKTLAVYCFKNGKTNFADMDEFIKSLYSDGIVDDNSVLAYLDTRINEDKLLKTLLSLCGLSRKIIPWDRETLAKWRSWNFSDEMLSEAAKLSAGKANPLAYMNTVLSAWKQEGIFSPDKIVRETLSPHNKKGQRKKVSILEQWQSATESLNNLTNKPTGGNQ